MMERLVIVLRVICPECMQLRNYLDEGGGGRPRLGRARTSPPASSGRQETAFRPEDMNRFPASHACTSVNSHLAGAGNREIFFFQRKTPPYVPFFLRWSVPRFWSVLRAVCMCCNSHKMRVSPKRAPASCGFATSKPNQ